jgi:ABC-2 type transport system permease protein
VIGIINEDNKNLSNIALSVLNNYSDVVFNSTNINEKNNGLDKVKNDDGVALIIIPKNFTNNIFNNDTGYFEIYWIMKGAGILDSVSSGVFEDLLSIINFELSKELINKGNNYFSLNTIVSPTHNLETTYFKDREMTGLSPGTITGMLSSQSTMVPIIMMMIILMSGGTVISSMALEKENKTLETLLTLPVKRTSIVTGKITASAAIGLLMALIYLFGFSNYMQSFNMSGNINLADFDLALSSQDYLLIGISLFITLIAGLALCMLLGTLAKNYKSAQTLTFPVTILAMIPMFITMFKDFDTLPLVLKVPVFAIPFSHPMMASRALIFDDYSLVIAGIIYVSIFAIILISIVVWIFKTDRILTGSTKVKKFFSFRKKS